MEIAALHREVDQEDRVKEVARMISGEKVTKTSIDHAKELIQGTKTSNYKEYEMILESDSVYIRATKSEVRLL